ncbi:MAG: CBS domain-containing protein [Chloroflexi bacterium]|nr:MAG: CBS domain-containing protein [Chloroflexota bacterium]
MNVGRRMSHPVFTVQPNLPITKAHELMAHEKIHRAPVVKNGRLVGIVTENDILKAYPSTATSLSVWEITSLLEKITVKDIMIKNVRTVQEDTPIEEAARILVDNKISALPVMCGTELVGIITETDLFRIMLEMLGARHPGVRFSVLMPYQPGQIAKLSQAIYEKGGNITALSTFEGDSSANFMMTIKVEGIEQAALQQLVEPLVINLVEIGTC